MSTSRVLKFGGTSLATPARLARAARRIAAFREAGDEVVAVVSARGHTTDRLLRSLARTSGSAGWPIGAAREADRLLATGEERSAALLAVALGVRGVAACSLRGGEAGIRAEGDFGAGRIVEIDGAELRRWLARGVVPVVAGFQGVRGDGETVTLGRGGSDTTAVALAAALGASCHLITDVDAVYDRDPRLHKRAVRLPTLDHESLVALASGGAGVVHEAAAHRALRHRVPLYIYHHSASGPEAGTRVGEVACAPC